MTIAAYYVVTALLVVIFVSALVALIFTATKRNGAASIGGRTLALGVISAVILIAFSLTGLNVMASMTPEEFSRSYREFLEAKRAGR